MVDVGHLVVWMVEHLHIGIHLRFGVGRMRQAISGQGRGGYEDARLVPIVLAHQHKRNKKGCEEGNKRCPTRSVQQQVNRPASHEGHHRGPKRVGRSKEQACRHQLPPSLTHAKAKSRERKKIGRMVGYVVQRNEEVRENATIKDDRQAGHALVKHLFAKVVHFGQHAHVEQ